MPRLFDHASTLPLESHFFRFPGSEKAVLKEIRPSVLFVDMEGQEHQQKELVRWISFCKEVNPCARVFVVLPDHFRMHMPEHMDKGIDLVISASEIHPHMPFLVRCLVEHHEAELSMRSLKKETLRKHSFHGMIGRSAAMVEIFGQIRRCAASRANILIRGESGTGKELVALAVHTLSSRGQGNLVTVNCAAINDNIHQSELFGHEKGAFTDAKFRRIGYFELAHNGTLFLDEIGDISPATQVALLRVIEGKEFFRVGGLEPIKVDVRVISATNRNLEEMVRQGRFREDLFYRLNGFTLALPPLRERKEDIPLLAEHFLRKFSRAEGKPVVGFTEEALDLLTCYHWPGNVRELENELQRIVIQIEKETVISSEMISRHMNVMESFQSNPSTIVPSLKVRMKQVEEYFIKEALKLNYGNRTRAARHLGISREGLHKKIVRYRIH
jgi:transcriptional regulator with PAS, ATPase and Fis domain